MGAPGEVHKKRPNDDEEDRDDFVLLLEIRVGALSDGGGDLDHLVVSLVLLHHRLKESDGEDEGRDGADEGQDPKESKSRREEGESVVGNFRGAFDGDGIDGFGRFVESGGGGLSVAVRDGGGLGLLRARKGDGGRGARERERQGDDSAQSEVQYSFADLHKKNLLIG